MNYIDNQTLSQANKEAVFNVYSYVANKGIQPNDGREFSKIVSDLRDSCNKGGWEESEIRQLEVLENALANDSNLGKYRIGNQTKSENGLNACTFTDGNGNVSVVFRGTGKGEWIDNGEALTGISEQNTYEVYGENGQLIKENTVANDYASDQQVEALNWFNKIASENGWNEDTNITISGHSKGGNKAQFVTINSDLVDNCYSFDGQGFSPEALTAFEEKYGIKFEERRQKILSFSADNDYVNVLGERLVPKDHIFFFESPIGDENAIEYHYMEAMLDENGKFNVQCEQGELSEYVENTSKELMEMDPAYRQYATRGIMNICQTYLGKGTPVNGDEVSDGDTVIGVAISAIPALTNLFDTKDGREAIAELVKIYGDDVVNGIGKFYDDIGDEHGVIAEAGAIIATIAAISFATPLVIDIGIKVIEISTVVKTIEYLADRLKETSQEIYANVKSFCTTTISALAEWYNKNLNKGYQQASENTYIRVNTDLLRNYANRLYSVNQRIVKLDKRLDTLYSKVGLLDLWNLLQADVLTGYSWRLNRCINYLNETADEFDSAERSMLMQL